MVARAPARHADVSRPRRARHPVRRARARARAAAGRRVSRSSRPALRGAVPGATFLLLSEAIDRARFGRRRGVRAELERVTADVLVVGVPGDLLFPYALQHELLSRAAGGRRDGVAVEARLRVRPRRVPRRSGQARRRCSATRGVSAAAQAAPRPRFDGVGARAAARDPHRHDRLRHRRSRRARAARSPGRRARRALRRAVPRHADRGARSSTKPRGRSPTASRSPIARSISSRIPTST